MFEQQKAFAREHIVLNSVQHVAAGFGLAVLLQEYMAGNSFVPLAIGWSLVGLSIAVHVYEFAVPHFKSKVRP